MANILLGFLIAICVGGVYLIFWFMMDEICEHTTTSTIFAGLGVIITIFTWIGSSLLLIDSEKTTYKSWTQQYISQKQLIEESLNNEKLSGFERVELVKRANELNSGLIDVQFKCVKWYNFTMDDKVLELEAVSLK